MVENELAGGGDERRTALARFGLGASLVGEGLRAGDVRAALSRDLAVDGGPANLGLSSREAISFAIAFARGSMVGSAPMKIYAEAVIARFQHAYRQEVGFRERLVWFWSNHFCVSAARNRLLRVAAGSFEAEAIRPHVTGKFHDLLVAAVTHPCMLIYLDNVDSVGPDSRRGTNRGGGLNENLAREILELHTLGVDGGYGQADVSAFAEALTGWTIAREGEETGLTVFRPAAHQPGARMLLGRAYPEAGADQLLAILADLAVHPSTARFVARKLACHFVADDPPASLVNRLEAVFNETGGDLTAMSEALVASEEAWQLPLTKLRLPQEYLISALRLLGIEPTQRGEVMQPLIAMGQPTWTPPGPNGFPDDNRFWATPAGLTARVDVAAHLARRVVPGTLRTALDRLGELDLATETRLAVARAESEHQALALLLMSPEHQLR